jgi:low temperature requirement protein LtrA
MQLMGIRLEQPPQADAPARWLRPPRLRTLAEVGERHASWLELFFDLVFVVAITELSHYLVTDHSAGGFLRFAALFFPVFVAWQGYTAYASRFDTDDLALRLGYFGAMLAILAMAVLIEDVAHGSHSGAFAIAYVVLRSIMLALYARAWRAVPEARALIRFYGVGYSAGVALWLVSLAFDTPWRYVIWAIAQVLELSLPPLSTQLHRRIPVSASHLPERWALFTLIVLGESVVAVAIAISGANWHFSSATAAVLGFAAVAAVWWLYFDRQAGVALRGSTMSIVVYSYAHIPLLIGLAAMSAGVRLLIERAGADHLGAGASVALLGGVLLYLAGLIGTRTVVVRSQHRLGLSLKLAAAAIIVALLAAETALPPLAVAAGLVGVLTAVVYLDRTLLEQTQQPARAQNP